MAYSDFTLEKAALTLGVTTELANLFNQPQVQEQDIPQWLVEVLSRRTQLALISEKARSEFIVVPILMACRELSHDQISIFSGQRLDIDADKGLVGECDFVLAAAPSVPPLRAPIFTVVEAKKNDVEAGLGQCIAQMVAANLFNQAAGQYERTIYGCVTTGEVWQFLRLHDAVALVDRERYYLDNLTGILGALQFIVQASIASSPNNLS